LSERAPTPPLTPPTREAATRASRLRALLGFLEPVTSPLDLGMLGRTLMHAALVGAAAGVAGGAFFYALELLQRLLLEDLAGYAPLRAAGETFFAAGDRRSVPSFRPLVLLVLPAFGALLSGLFTQLAPETRGGGGDAMIEAFHHHGGLIRRRVAWVKGLASLSTLGFGGSGGREGPTMQIGGALGCWVSRALQVSPRERRVLLLAGVAAGVTAVFRTPLGAALLAVEVPYRDGFESEALIPSVLSSVVSYSVVTTLLGETTLFSVPMRFPFVPAHLALYGLLAVLVAFLASAFVLALRGVRSSLSRLPIPTWARPACGGLLLGVLVTPLVVLVSARVGQPGQGLGLLGGGYGAAQIAILGASWLPEGWNGVELLLLLSAAKLVATACTIGSGGSAGDFAPSLVLGGLFGGAFGRAATLLLDDPRLNPAAFALVGMGAFYGGIAHCPLSALVLVCEMAGSYDLLVPLMLAEGIAFVLLRERTLYEAQLPTQRDSPAHRGEHRLDRLGAMRVGDVMMTATARRTFALAAGAAEMLSASSEAVRQLVFPVVDTSGALVGVIAAEALALLGAVPELHDCTLAADLMQPPLATAPEDDLPSATRLMLDNDLRELPVVDSAGAIVGFLDEAALSRMYLSVAAAISEPSEPG
jgi:CIC family chloride channel protein